MENEACLNEKKAGPKWGTRHTQTAILFLCVIIAFGLRINLSVAVIAMTNKSSANNDFVELRWNESEKMLVLGSFFWGYPITPIISGQMAQKYGAKHILAISLGLSGILTIITPITAIYGGIVAMCINRLVQGMAQGAIFPATFIFLSKWAPLSEKSRISSFVFSGIQFGRFSMLPVAGLLASSAGGWPSVFYASGFVTLLWTLAWCMWGANSPEDHRSISKEEKEYIVQSLSKTTSKKSLPTPWRDIFQSIPMWMLIIVHCTQNWTIMVLLTEMPSYFAHVLKFNIKTNGYLSALPYLLKWFFIILSSWISDYINTKGLIALTKQKKIWNSIAHWGAAAVLFSLYFVDTTVTEALILLSVTIVVSGAIVTGFSANHLDLAPNFAGTLFGITCTAASLSTSLGMMVKGVVVTDSTNKEQWNNVFLCWACILFVGNLLFVLFGSAEVQSWNDLSTPKDIKN